MSTVSPQWEPPDDDERPERPKRRRTRMQIDDTARLLAAMSGGTVEEWTEKLNAEEPFNDQNIVDAGWERVAEYNYTDPAGDILYRVVRYRHFKVPGEKKFIRIKYNYGGDKKGWRWGSVPLRVPYRWADIATRPNEIVYYTEGEKDADRLAKLGLVATTLASQDWSDTAAAALAGRQVVVLEDNDEKGRHNGAVAVEQLTGIAAQVKLIRLPGLRHKEDVSDWLDAGHTKDELIEIANATRESGIRPTAIPWIDGKTIPVRRWLYKPFYIQQFLSALIATGGIGKSTLVIAEALAMVSGKPLLGVKPGRRLKVWYWNGEDPTEELHRRFAAAMKLHELTQDDIGDRLFIDSGRISPIVIAAESQRWNVKVNELAVQQIISVIREKRIDVMVVDPFVTCHRVNENDNAAIELVAKAWAHIAEVANCSVMIVHHTRKPNSGDGASVDDSRGASALLAAVRSARVMNTMKIAEAEAAGIAVRERRFYFNTDNGKTNLTRPAEARDWFKLASVNLENDINFMDDGDDVGVATHWTYPVKDLPGLNVYTVPRIQDAIRAGGPWRLDPRSQKEPWAGEAVARALGINMLIAGNRKAVGNYLRDLIQSGALRVEERPDKNHEQRDYVEAPVVGASAGASDAAE